MTDAGTLAEPKRTLVANRTRLLLAHVITVLSKKLGERDTYNLLQEAADSVADRIVQPEKRHHV